MNKIQFTGFHVKRYRSLLDVKIDVSTNNPVVICGENNIGKTNLLRALNVFFNHIFKEDIFVASEDIPHHIYYGSQGAGSKTELTGYFNIEDKNTSIKVTFNNFGEPTYLISNKAVKQSDVAAILSKIQYLYVESHNIDLPQLISVVLEKDGLLPLDNKRKKQSQPLEKLEEFISLSQKAIADIEKNINLCFKDLTNFDGILRDKEIKINFAEFDKLRDVVKTMTSITLYDGNNHGIASKGSGAQRAVFLSLMQFISQNSKKNIIWGIDEPEAFLQPRLQKKVAEVFSDIVEKKKQPVILTTHSQHFIDLNNLENTHLFIGQVSERKYKRKPGEVFYEMDTAPFQTNSNYEKASLIKQHLGISNNDGWEVFPYNILVEGEEDKKYLETLMTFLNHPVPNIVFSGGASKIGGYLQYYNLFAQDLKYKPEFVCIFDNDNEGRDQSKRIKPKSYKHMDVKLIELPRHDGTVSDLLSGDWEIEDFLPPDVVLKAVNKILKKDSYKVIKKTQINDRDQPAHIKKQILKYAEECCNQNNSDKPPFELDNEGRKKQICMYICEHAEALGLIEALNKNQKGFIQKLVT